MPDFNKVLLKLNNSKFRSSFKLKGKELEYMKSRGIDEILNHADDFIRTRLAPAEIPNDGKQTPFGNHPVFVAQHATATCCRGCLQKWHNIQKGKRLNDEEIEYIIKMIHRWLVNNSA